MKPAHKVAPAYKWPARQPSPTGAPSLPITARTTLAGMCTVCATWLACKGTPPYTGSVPADRREPCTASCHRLARLSMGDNLHHTALRTPATPCLGDQAAGSRGTRRLGDKASAGKKGRKLPRMRRLPLHAGCTAALPGTLAPGTWGDTAAPARYSRRSSPRDTPPRRLSGRAGRTISCDHFRRATPRRRLLPGLMASPYRPHLLDERPRERSSAPRGHRLPWRVRGRPAPRDMALPWSTGCRCRGAV